MAALDFRLFSGYLINQSQLEQLAQADIQSDIEAIQYIAQKKWFSEAALLHKIAQRYYAPAFNIKLLDTQSIPPDLLNKKLSMKHSVLPLFLRGRTLFLATVNPISANAIDDFQFNTGYNVEYVVVEATALQVALEAVYESNGLELDEDMLSDSDMLDVEVEKREEDEDTTTDAENSPVIDYVQKLLALAIKQGASDLHFEPYENTYRIRFRTDGVLKNISKPDKRVAKNLASSIKVMSSLNIAEKRKPQDGRLRLKINTRKSIDLRVSTLPTIWGEKVVMRILDSSSAMMGIDALGYEADQQSLFLNALEKPQGMILVTGPTGSGKTVSLYTGLNLLNTEERNISTAEDPVEINLEGINQVQINNKAGLNFAEALRSFLRQDPDIIMVGEIRDLETAEIAIKAAQTGHLVLSTLHTNSAAETLTRLQNMGVANFNIASSVSLIIAQRLVRKLCDHCKKPSKAPINKVELAEFGFKAEQLKNLTLLEPVGCDFCVDGYKGRVGIYEVMPMSTQIASMIMQQANSLQIAEQAALEGVDNLRASGIKKVVSGITSLTEVSRVTSF